MSSVTETFNVNEDALAIVQLYGMNLDVLLFSVVLSTFLFGVLTVLSGTSTYFLFRKRSQQRTVVSLLASILVLYVSTAAYWATILADAISRNQLVGDASAGILISSYSPDMAHHKAVVMRHTVIATIGLTVNMLLGDCIVWWRAYVLWRTKFVLALGVGLITITLAIGIMGAVHASNHLQPSIIMTLLYTGAIGTTFPLLSLLTNVLATALIAIKAWRHKQLLQAFLGKDGGSAEVMKVLVLLIESGAIYSAIWILVALYQVLQIKSLNNPFVIGFSFFIYGCLAPIIAIYPTFIIFLVALNRSQLEASLSPNESDSPMSTRIGPFATSTAFDVRGSYQVELPAFPDHAMVDEPKDDDWLQSLRIERGHSGIA
ncbi:hypothetical protein DICSQDRAFT_177060 [Dichomitus squalens LYAD-421 SS1]|uniref:uncharacterized protein n=1 Tax=Dichomitus squalens (strain LYAD-421) TaxID=732165 RepID=UPI0004411B3A|nr:uncharacterized protein DICSQDRAFT_177060 [Dichomitus squalens LYAD-421 SS1]EJF67447.1 hypothetical protein DICSQDRAFT_177060 [Dichomitus squalens LYAD-421 SS1]